MLGTHSNACQLEILALNPRAQARTGRWRKNSGTKAATRRPAPCNPKNGMLYRHFRGHYAAVTEHDEIRFSHPHAKLLGARSQPLVCTSYPTRISKYGFALECKAAPIGVILLISSSIVIKGKSRIRCSVSCLWRTKAQLRSRHRERVLSLRWYRQNTRTQRCWPRPAT